MWRWITVIAAVIIISVIIYRVFIYSPVYKVEQEEITGIENQTSTVSYIVTTGTSARISIRDIDSFTSEKNFPFTRFNMKPELNKKVSQERI